MKVVERVFPKVNRYIVVLRVSSKKIQYVLHARDCKNEIIEYETL